VRLTISKAARREVLARLLQLNHECHAQEVRQRLHEKKGKQGGIRNKQISERLAVPYWFGRVI
jgi:hypothetical protein